MIIRPGQILLKSPPSALSNAPEASYIIQVDEVFL